MNGTKTKCRYTRPTVTAIRVDNAETVMAASGNFEEPPTGEMDIYPDAEQVDPKDALSKGHHSVWDDGWD